MPLTIEERGVMRNDIVELLTEEPKGVLYPAEDNDPTLVLRLGGTSFHSTGDLHTVRYDGEVKHSTEYDNYTVAKQAFVRSVRREFPWL